MKTNIRKLHEVLEFRSKVGSFRLPRRCGKTLLLCHELVGAIEVGDFKTIVVGIVNNNRLESLIPMLTDVLKEHGMEYDIKQKKELLCNNKVIRFIEEQRLGETIIRFNDFYYQYLN